MDTLQEALFRDMLNNGWFTNSNGDVESPTGFFGYVVNTHGDWSPEFVSVFEDTIAAYGGDTDLSPESAERWREKNFYGVWSAYIDSDGIINIYKHGGYVRTVGVPVFGIELTQPVRHAMQTFRNRSDEYQEWAAATGRLLAGREDF